jgi:Xaa-Pro aminopeptidase
MTIAATSPGADDRRIGALSVDEMERRRSAVRAEMRDRSIDAIVVQASNDWLGGYLRWFVGLPANNAYPRAAVVPVEGPISLVQQGPFDGVTELDGTDDSYPGVGRLLTTPSYVTAAVTAHYDSDLIVGELRRLGCRTVAVVAPTAMYHGFVDGLTAALTSAGVTVVDATDWVDEVKAIKSPEEQQLIRQTAELQDEVLTAVKAHIRPGMRDFEVAAFAQYQAHLAGAEQGIYLGSSAPVGHAATFLPGWQQGRTIRAGDVFTMLIETNGPGGHYTELSRPTAMGPAPAELKDAWALAAEAQQHSLGLLRPGVSSADVHASHNEFMAAAGMSEEKRLYAHGQGHDMVERPLIRQDETMRIAAGMSLTVHPSVKTGAAFVAVVDNYLVGADGPGQCIHRTPKQIIEIS